MVPRDFQERLEWMCDVFNLSQKKMDEIIEKKNNMERYLEYYSYKVVLYEVPEGMPRPRYRFIGPRNYMDAAKAHPSFIHVYSPTAGDDFRYMRRMVESELDQLHVFVQTPCNVKINSFFQTPAGFSIVDKFLAEIGLHMNSFKPDWDNIEKKYSDMYNHNMWLDDSLVTSGVVNKFYSMLPRVEIDLTYLNYATNKYQYDRITNRKDYRPEYPINYLNAKGEPNGN